AIFFCLSSRRRHTRCYRDWSSDVCYSDLSRRIPHPARAARGRTGSGTPRSLVGMAKTSLRVGKTCRVVLGLSWWSGKGRSYFFRSEERRVGKEGSSLVLGKSSIERY